MLSQMEWTGLVKFRKVLETWTCKRKEGLLPGIIMVTHPQCNKLTGIRNTCSLVQLKTDFPVTSLQMWDNLYLITTISKSIRQELSSFIRHKAVVNVKLRCFQSTRKLQSCFSVKDRQALLNWFNVVYKLTCSCGASYIGQTQRNLINRIEEHRTSRSSSVCRHLQANPDHRVDFHNPEVIGSDNNWRRLQILESLLIQEHKPQLNANILSMPLCIFKTVKHL